MARGVTSKEHELLVKQVAEYIDGEEVIIKGNFTIIGKYFPDVKTENIDVECEIVPRKSYLLGKTLKWDKHRKKMLVLGLQDFTLESFDQILFWDIKNNKLLFKIK